MRRLTSLAALCSVTAVLGLTSCSNPTEGGGGQQQANSGDILSSIQTDDTIAAMLPAQITAKGGLTASINADSAPIKFLDTSGQVIGLSPELLRAAAKVLGTKIDFVQGSFDAQVPGLESSRYDLVASIGDLVQRQTNIDFIDYLKVGTAILASKSFAQDQVTPDQLCGLSVGYGRGSAQQGFLEKAAAACVTAGKPELKINGYQDPAAGILSVKSGQADGYWGDGPPMAYNVKNDPTLFKIVYAAPLGVLGIGIRKDNPQLRDALRAALLKLAQDGTYDKLLAEWGVGDSGVPSLPINTAGAKLNG